MAEIKTCSKCGQETDTLYLDSYCSDCYSVIWDAGFESTTDWGAKIAHNDFVRDLNSVLGNREEAEAVIYKITSSFDPGNWYCEDCGTVIIESTSQDNYTAAEIYDLLINGCGSCTAGNNIAHDYNGER